jgi:hypothetical protein
MTPSIIHNKPLIRTGCIAEKTMTCPTIGIDSKSKENDVTGKSDHGDLLLRGFWARGTNCIVEVRVTDTDAKSYCKQPPDKVLESGEKMKKKKYLEACLEQRRHFTPFICLVDGLLAGREAHTFAKHLAAKLAKKWQRSYSQTCGYVNVRRSIAIIRATQHLCFCVVGVGFQQARSAPNPLNGKMAGAGLALFECYSRTLDTTPDHRPSSTPPPQPPPLPTALMHHFDPPPRSTGADRRHSKIASSINA